MEKNKIGRPIDSYDPICCSPIWIIGELFERCGATPDYGLGADAPAPVAAESVGANLGGPGKPATQAAEAGTPNDVSRLTEQVGWKMQVGTWRMKMLPHTAHFAKARAGRGSGEKRARMMMAPGKREEGAAWAALLSLPPCCPPRPQLDWLGLRPTPEQATPQEGRRLE